MYSKTMLRVNSGRHFFDFCEYDAIEDIRFSRGSQIYARNDNGGYEDLAYIPDRGDRVCVVDKDNSTTIYIFPDKVCMKRYPGTVNGFIYDKDGFGISNIYGRRTGLASNGRVFRNGKLIYTLDLENPQTVDEIMKSIVKNYIK